MPQLAPVNWLFLFFIFWFIVALSSILVWWFSKTEYTIEGIHTTETEMTTTSDASTKTQMKSWNW